MQFHATLLTRSGIICLEILLALGVVTLIASLFFSGSRETLPARRQMLGRLWPSLLIVIGTAIVIQTVMYSMPHLSHRVQLILRGLEALILVGVVIVRSLTLQQVPPEIRAEFYHSMLFKRIKPVTTILVLGVVIAISAIAGYTIGR